MKARRFLMALLPVAAAFALTSCSSDDASDSSVQPQTGGVKKIPYTVTIGDVTRAGVADDQSTLNFATGDQLYIKGTGVSGMLSIKDGVGTPNATFEGTLDYTGEGSTPAADLALTATLKSSNQQGWNNDGTVTLPASALCTSLADAVSKYSYLKGTSTFGEKTFRLVQQTTFLNFTVTFADGTEANKQVSVSVKNGNGVIGSGSVTTASGGDVTTAPQIVASFVVPVQGGTVLTGAQVIVGNKTFDFGASQTTGLDAKVYNINKTVRYTPAVGMIIGANGHVYPTVSDAVSDGTTGVAIIAYLGSETAEADYTGGLAFALKDAINPNPQDKGLINEQPYDNYNTPMMHWASVKDVQHNANMSENVSELLTLKESGSALSSGRGDKNDNDYIDFPAFYAAVNNTISINANDGITANVLEDGSVACSEWFLPSIYQWNQMVRGLSGCTDDYKGYIGPFGVPESAMGDAPNDNLKADKYNLTITNAGGVALIPGGYWSSSECDKGSGWNYNCGYGCAYSNFKDVWAKVRATVAFNVVQ